MLLIAVRRMNSGQKRGWHSPWSVLNRTLFPLETSIILWWLLYWSTQLPGFNMRTFWHFQGFQVQDQCAGWFSASQITSFLYVLTCQKERQDSWEKTNGESLCVCALVAYIQKTYTITTLCWGNRTPAPHIWLHLSLITSQRCCVQNPSRCRSEFQCWKWGLGCNSVHSSYYNHDKNTGS